MRRDIARAIRRRQPDAVVVGSWDVEFAAGLNQADHRVAGLATLDAVRDAGNRWVFPELLDEGLAAARRRGGCSSPGTRGRPTASTSPASRWNAASPPWKRTPSTWPASPATPRSG